MRELQQWWIGLGKELEEDIETIDTNFEIIRLNSTSKMDPKYNQDGS